MGGQKAKKKPKAEQEMITYSQFTKKPPANLRENDIPVKNGKLVGDVQVAWASYSEDEKGKISTVWHVLKIEQKFAEEHLSGAKPGVIEAAMKAAAEGKKTSEIEYILIHGKTPEQVEQSKKWLEAGTKVAKVYTKLMKEKKAKQYLEVGEKIGKLYEEGKLKKPPIPFPKEKEKVMPKEKPKTAEVKKPTKEKPKVKEKPSEKPKGASDIDEILAKVGKGKEAKAPESGLGGIAGPGKTSEAVELGKVKTGEAATGKVKTTGPEEKGIVSNIKIAEPESKPAGSSSAANAMLKSVDATLTTVGTTEETKYKDVVNFYYNKLGKKPGGGATTRYGTITFEAPNGEKYKFFIFITTADFERAGIKDLSDMSDKEREKAINKMTNDIFDNMVKWLGTSKLPKSDQPAVKTGVKNMVTKLVDGIVEERSKVIELG